MTAIFFNGLMRKMLLDGKKKALIEARNEIHEKNKTITELKKTTPKLRSDLVKK